jgi:hypothetical protein
MGAKTIKKMTKTSDLPAAEPWRALPASVADLIEPELGPITEAILASIASEVPEYARPLEGRFGRGIHTGVAEALSQFVALIRDPDAGRETSREVYLALGRGEQRQGRPLDSLQAAYRIGARVAWRRFADAGSRADLAAEPLAILAEACFAYIDELAADSVEGYAQAQAEVEDLRRRRRAELVALLLLEPAAEPGDVAAAARAAGWRPPARLAAIACPEPDLAAVARRLPPETLATVVDGTGCLLLPDPDGPGRAEVLERAARPSRAAATAAGRPTGGRRAEASGSGSGPLALGPTVAPGRAAESWALAAALLRASAAGALPVAGLLRAEDELAPLLLFEGRDLTARIARRRLAPLADLTAKGRRRMEETALAHVRHNGNAVAMAAEMHVHPQTARYRAARLRELLGDQLDDPDARFELELALRANAALS